MAGPARIPAIATNTKLEKKSDMRVERNLKPNLGFSGYTRFELV